jgi:outer membrane protein OmpA-like peptidoglycan-associated protein
MKKILYLFALLFLSTVVAVDATPLNKLAEQQNPGYTKKPYADSAVILIPFDYKQSALYHAYTYEVIDSVVNLLLKDSSITLSINGYAHQDEGSDTICKYLSLNRALFVRDYILGRGVQPFRLIFVRGMGKKRSEKTNVNKDGHALNCRAELVLNYPAPPPPPHIEDKDGDGIADADDACAYAYGYRENNGCPDKDAIVIPFDYQQSWLSPVTYKALDSLIVVLKENPALKLSVQGHAYPAEGINSLCERLAIERANIVKNYLLSRNIATSRILSVKGFGNSRPYNAGKNPREMALNSRAQIMIEK